MVQWVVLPPLILSSAYRWEFRLFSPCSHEFLKCFPVSSHLFGYSKLPRGMNVFACYPAMYWSLMRCLCSCLKPRVPGIDSRSTVILSPINIKVMLPSHIQNLKNEHIHVYTIKTWKSSIRGVHKTFLFFILCQPALTITLTMANICLHKLLTNPHSSSYFCFYPSTILYFFFQISWSNSPKYKQQFTFKFRKNVFNKHKKLYVLKLPPRWGKVSFWVWFLSRFPPHIASGRLSSPTSPLA